MENEKIIHELDRRIETLFKLRDKEKKQYLRIIAAWILYHPELQDIYSTLDRLGYVASQNVRNLENELYQQILTERKEIIPIYNNLRKEIYASFKSEYADEAATYYVDNYDNNDNFSKGSVDSIYHWHRQIVEKIGFIQKRLVSRYVDEHMCLSSESYKLFVKLSESKTKFDKIYDSEEFGSLGYIRQILLESGKINFIDYDSYLDVMGIDFIILHLVKIRDYIYDYFFNKKIYEDDTENIDLSKNIWAIVPKTEDSTLIVGDYKIPFYFDRNPNESKTNISFEMIKVIIKAGQGGINKLDICKQNPQINSKDISGYLNHINTRLVNNTGEYNCRLISFGSRGNKKIFMAITKSEDIKQ